MKKSSTVAVHTNEIFKQDKLTLGLDLGDRFSHYCILDEAGNVILEHNLPTTPKGIDQVFRKVPRSRIALETGTHSPWVSRQLSQLGHEVIVAHARNVRLIGESSRKDDQLDARTLARLARIDPGLLGPVRHRSAKAQIHLTVIRARAALVGTRTALVNAARGLTKSYGERLNKCGTEQMNRESSKGLSQELRDALDPLLREIESLNERIAEYDRRIEQIAKEVHPEVALLKQVKGVGTLIALTYVLTLDDPQRFRRSRDAGCFLGLRPGRRNSGKSEPQLHISSESPDVGKTAPLLQEGVMSETGDNDKFRTLRGFLRGDEPNEETYFAYSATLRIFGDIPDLNEITRHLGVAPTSAHRKGDRRAGPDSPPYKHDMWTYTAPVNKTEPLHVHIDALWTTFRDRKQYLLQLKHGLKVDVFLGYRSNCDNAGVEVRHESLEIFVELQVPFGLSIIVT